MSRRRVVSLIKDPAARSIGLAILITISIGYLRPDGDVTGVPPDVFWATKLDWRGCADVVIAGDSRVYRGISPSEMEQILPDTTVLNYGFSSMGYSEMYLKAIHDVLDPASARRVIILGINGRSLTQKASKDNGFVWHLERPLSERAFSRWLGALLHKFRPTDLLNHKVPALLAEKQEEHYYQHYRGDGWAACYKVPETPDEAIEAYRELLDRDEENVVSDKIVNELLQAVTAWRKEGIEVYGFQPPCGPDLMELESRLTECDDSTLIARFEAAGGKWLRLPEQEYHTYDGNHLHRDEAVRFSRVLARALLTSLASCGDVAAH